ncbi:MAG: hypothetical protein HOQ05_03020 [Corynebacteriales bacterium]|jgi:hypothetical protein|nr:hypothetical protein [Mycobacteriales bacterium]
MGHWFTDNIINAGKLELFCFFAAMIVAFIFIRVSVRLIRAQVRWWPGNVSPGGLHIHHVVFGVVFMLVGGIGGLALDDSYTIWRAMTAAIFGVGAALVLDEFALILHLKDVYWAEEGRTSIDAVFIAIAFTGLLLLGMQPLANTDLQIGEGEGTAPQGAFHLLAVSTLINLALAVVTLIKGKLWSGLFGLFIPFLLIVTSIRLARPNSAWARSRYRADTPRGQAKLATAERREERLRRPIIRAKIWLQEFIGGKHDLRQGRP